MITAAERYPELEQLASDISETICNRINNYTLFIDGTDCPYPAQCILELLIDKLQSKV